MSAHSLVSNLRQEWKRQLLLDFLGPRQEDTLQNPDVTDIPEAASAMMAHISDDGIASSYKAFRTSSWWAPSNPEHSMFLQAMQIFEVHMDPRRRNPADYAYRMGGLCIRINGNHSIEYVDMSDDEAEGVEQAEQMADSVTRECVPGLWKIVQEEVLQQMASRDDIHAAFEAEMEPGQFTLIVLFDKYLAHIHVGSSSWAEEVVWSSSTEGSKKSGGSLIRTREEDFFPAEEEYDSEPDDDDQRWWSAFLWVELVSLETPRVQRFLQRCCTTVCLWAVHRQPGNIMPVRQRDRDMAFAFMMAQHKRLGKDAACRILPNDVVCPHIISKMQDEHIWTKELCQLLLERAEPS